ncbi:hypothetical protein OF83DRAFT_1059040 [Amylostereum chailletii]|nr:hypothetical protein OF83DRAFT_1059040 [Amylostereum chailletii]
MPDSGAENKVCPGCQQSVMNENGGVVIAFGQSFFHVECFKCAKCHDTVTADTNLLLLSDGQPVCSNCSYSCSVCHLPILDEAIMTGDDSYHAHCFKCKACHNRIDELMFAKTSHGIYCMSCHHQRVARSRRHAQKQKERELEKERAGSASGSGSSGMRELSSSTPSSTRSPPTAPLSPPPSHGGRPRSPSQLRSATLPSPTGASASSSPNSSSRRQSTSTPLDGPVRERQSPTGANGQVSHLKEERPSPSSPALAAFSVSNDSRLAPSHRPSSPAVVIPPEHAGGGSPSSLDYLRPSSNEPQPGRSLLSPPDSAGSLQRRKSYDDGVRPLNLIFKKGSPVDTDAQANLSLPNTKGRSSKRNSINPAIPFDLEAIAREMEGAGMSSARSSSPASGRESPHRAPSPLRERSGSDLVRKPSPNGLSGLSAVAGRPRTESSPKPITQTQSEFARAPLHPSVTLDRVPVRGHGYSPSQDLNNPDRIRGPGLPSNVRPKLSDERGARPGASSLSIDVERSRLGLNQRDRPMSPAYKVASPSHKVDVPHSIESGTDTDPEGDGSEKRSDSSHGRPPVPPPKEGNGPPWNESSLRHPQTTPRNDLTPRAEKLHARPEPHHHVPKPISQDDSFDSSNDDQDSSDESSPIERASHSTFIAPALPPIRFSMGGGDFSDLLKSVGGRNSIRSFDQLIQVSEDSQVSSPETPASRQSWRSGSTPTSATSATTFTLSTESHTSADDSSTVTTVPSGHEHDITKSQSRKGASTEALSRQSSSRSADGHGSNGVTTFPTSGGRRSSLDIITDQKHVSSPSAQRTRFDSTASFNPDASIGLESSAAKITVTAPGSSLARPLKYETSDLVTRRLREALTEASKRGSLHVNLDQEFIQTILMVIEQRKVENAEMKGKLDHIKRASQQYMDGLTVAQGEYEAELQARHDAEAEVTRLRVLLSGQAARITAMSNEARKGDLHKQLSRELSENLGVLERNISKLRVERDVTLAEVEELASTKSSPNIGSESSTTSLSRSLTARLDTLKTQYQRELVPLTDERGSLLREIAELKAARDTFLEETTMLNARNEELAQLHALYIRRSETTQPTALDPLPSIKEKSSQTFERPSTAPAVTNPLQPSNTVNSSLQGEDSMDSNRFVKVQKPLQSEQMDQPGTLRGKFKWRGNNKESAAMVTSFAEEKKEKSRVTKLVHSFQQVSVLRVTRCDHCGDKLWGSQARCTGCNVSVHHRCQAHMQSACMPQNGARKEMGASTAPLPPSMFGRELTEQVRADTRYHDSMVPVIVEKCIEAVDNIAIEYEGIYRKTGGSGQSKMITQLFESGDYDSFDLKDTDRFNDICSVTSVLKTYFRSLPNPLLTFVLHDEFMHASTIKDPVHKSVKYADLVKQLPTEHYYTLRMLMLHLHRIHEHSAQNLMTARNLGVVFGPTLMRSRNPGAEFSDMAGKALSVEWLVENAADIFPPLPSSMH